MKLRFGPSSVELAVAKRQSSCERTVDIRKIAVPSLLNLEEHDGNVRDAGEQRPIVVLIRNAICYAMALVLSRNYAYRQTSQSLATRSVSSRPPS